MKLVNVADKYSLDWAEVTLRIVEDSSFRILLGVLKDGNVIVINVEEVQ
ncbi:hypothetical protein QFZ31_006688 [Neobacillus niacini]|nr:hypothetical protein [Neobacillus niacini]MDQ0976636.1 hypothetical protein [Neobacillus niacini]